MSAKTYDRDHEVVQRLRPEPMTPEEAAAQGAIADIDFEIFCHKMQMITHEGKETTMKLGASTAMRAGDIAFGIFTAQGDLSICATGIYHHAVLGQIPIKYIVKHWLNESAVSVNDGDSFFYNDPFYGGVHAADMGLAIPVFYDGRLICFVGAAVHTGECGGSEPGGFVQNAKSKYDEGLIAPPIKVGENYTLREDILNMFAAMNRDPRAMILDIKARLAAARIAQRRILEVVEEQGVEFFVGSLRRVLKVTSEAARRKVSLLNDGVYRQPRFLDMIGTEAGLVKINLAVIKKGDRLTLDLTGSSPMMGGKPMNCFFQGIIGLAMVYFCGWFFNDLPANNGLLEAVDWKFPDDSFINAHGDTSTSLAPVVQVCFSLGMFLCGAKMVYSSNPDRASAPWYMGFGCPIYAGRNQHGEPVADVTPEVNGGGGGALSDHDGADVAGAWFATLSDCTDVEITETDRPILYLSRNLFSGSVGHGKYRGGAGVGIAMMVHHVPELAMGAFGSGAHFPMTLGLFGGYAVPPTFIQVVQGSNMDQLMHDNKEPLPRNLTEVYDAANPERGERAFEDVNMLVRPLHNGDTYYMSVGGGGGYGDAIQRDPEAVLRDLKFGRITAWAAQNIYHVVYDAEALRLDEAATQSRRQEVLEARKKIGRPYDEFMADWQKLSPPNDITQYYGAYPYPEKGVAPQPMTLAATM
ncbi:MAG: hypothetical protein DCC73_02980 [Proteobacteria bacterium]|nr:MAG: hypothetical protein DCC73_02980 [Pseudomonadota bacterium]